MSDEISAEKSAVTVSTRDAQQTGKGLAVWLAGVLPEGADPEVLDITAPDSNGMSSETLLFDAVWTEDGERVHHAAAWPGSRPTPATCRCSRATTSRCSSGSCSSSASTRPTCRCPGVRWLELDALGRSARRSS